MSFEALWSRAKEVEAERLLGDSELSVAKIAARLGYSDSRTLSHFFRARTEGAPRDIRRTEMSDDST